MNNIRIIILPFTLILSILLIWFLVKPIYDGSNSLNQSKIPQLENSIQQENDLQQRIEKLSNEGGGTGQQTISDALPENKEVKELIAQLEFIVKKEKMTLTNISVKDNSSIDQSAAGLFGQTGNDYQQIEGDFEVRGNYGQFKLLMKDIRKLTRIVNINQVNVANTTDEGGSAIGKYILNFSTYWQPAITEEQSRTGLENRGPTNPGVVVSPGIPTLPATR